ncbi:MAG: hypothetical protein AAFZ15_08535 [Bacteroidota bacterium]
MNQNWKHLTLFLSVFLLHSCISGPLKKSLELKVTSDHSVRCDNGSCEGIALNTLYHVDLQENDNLNIILTHGVGDPQEHHFAEFKKTLMQGMGYEANRKGIFKRRQDWPTPEPIKINGFRKTAYSNAPIVNKTTYEIDDFFGKKKKVTIYDIDWSPMTTEFKKLIYDDLDTNHYRTYVANLAKKELFINHVGDLALYLGSYYKNIMQSPFQQVLNAIGTSPEPGATVFMGGSFGVEMLMDAFDKTDAQIKKDIACQTPVKAIYLLSNQLPFTSMMTIPMDTQADLKSLSKHIYGNLIRYKAFLDTIPNAEPRTSLSTNDPPILVSFYDPNDIFGYRLPKPETSWGLKVYNIKAFNTLEWSFSPSKLRDNYLNRIKDENIQKAIRENLNHRLERQYLKLDPTGPSKKAKDNVSILMAILDGQKFLDDKVLNNKIDLISYERDTIYKAKTKRGKELLKVKRKHIVVKMLSKLVTARAGLLFKNMDMYSARLPLEYPSESFNNRNMHFTGISESVEAHDITNIVTVHGMRSKEYDHFDVMVNGLVDELDFRPNVLREDTLYLSPPKTTIEGRPSIILREFVHEDDPQKKLRFFIVYWSPLTKPAKELLQELDEDPKHIENTSFALELLKKILINDGFADVMLSTQTLNSTLHKLYDKAYGLVVCQDPFKRPGRANRIARGDGDKNTFFITGSLGSNLMMHHAAERLKNNGHAAYADIRQVLKKTDKFFMLSNQMQIIAFKNLKDNVINRTSYIKNIYGDWDGIRRAPELNIVAFNDPNDLLGFRLPTLGNNSNLKIQNVSLNIASGFEIDQVYTHKFAKKVDKIVLHMIDANKLEATEQAIDGRLKRYVEELERRKERIADESTEKIGKWTRDDYKKIALEYHSFRNDEFRDKYKKDKQLKVRDYKNLFSPVVFHLLHDEMQQHSYDRDMARQQLIARLDIAHEGVSGDPRVFNILCYGMEKIKKSRRREFPPPGN